MKTKQPMWTLALALLVVAGSLHASTEAAVSIEDLKSEGAQLTQDGKWSEAALVFEKLTGAEPDDAQHWASLGLAYRNQERLDEAIDAYEHALRLDGSSFGGLAGMAVTLEKLGRLERAFHYLTELAGQGVSPRMLQQNPAFEGLRAHERFAAVLEVAERKSNPCIYEERYDDFDFWIGNWDVHIRGQKRAENLITKEMNGCIIRERYHNEFGYEGESINYYDPESGKWKQNWVDRQGGIVRYTGGLAREGVMSMEGANTSADGRTQLARVTWTLRPDGKVHHVIEQSADEGRTWQAFFDGIYVMSERDPGK